jgi:hypothetical protein
MKLDVYVEAGAGAAAVEERGRMKNSVARKPSERATEQERIRAMMDEKIGRRKNVVTLS